MSARRIESFLLRLVVQDDGSANPEHWRGRIKHVTTGSEQQIEQLQDVIAFITLHLGGIEIAPAAPTTPHADSSSAPRNAS